LKTLATHKNISSFWRIGLLGLLALSLAACAGDRREAALRFAWLSDTHVGGWSGEKDLVEAVRDINHLQSVDFVIISGDVTEYGSNEQLLRAKEILDSLTMPYHIIPGNHDTRWSESGMTLFPRLWGNDRFVLDRAGYRFIGLHQGPRMRMGDGHWAPEDLRWLDSVLVSLPEEDAPVIFVTHYPLDPGIANWYEAVERLKQYNIQVVLVGHGHAGRILDFEGIPGVMGRSSLRRRDSVGGYTIVEIREDSILFAERKTGLHTLPIHHGIPIRSDGIKGISREYLRPDFSVNFRYAVDSLWRYSTGYTIATSPTVVESTIVVCDASGSVYGLELDGSLRWRSKTGGSIYSNPDAGSGLVVLGSTDSLVYCLDGLTGETVWEFKTGGPVCGSPRIDAGLVFVGGSDGVFRALDLHSGDLLWEFGDVEGYVESRPLVYQGKVFFGAWDGSLYALDSERGDLVWKWSGSKPGFLFSPAACWPVGAEGKVFIVAPDRMMTALDATTGKEVWRTGRFQVRESIGVSEDGKRVYVRTMKDSLVAIDATAADCQPIWVRNAGFGYDINSAMLVEYEGLLLYGTKTGLLLGIEGSSGLIRWEYRSGVGLVNTLCPVDPRRVVVTDVDGHVTLLRHTG
jgi:outer membrane protein assembly factor BamB/predicted phosphohydrolase